MLFNRLYFSESLLSCFDGDDDAAAAAAAAAATNPFSAQLDPLAAAAAAAGAHPNKGKTFTQEEVNTFLAKENRKQQAALEKLEASYRAMLNENKNLSEKERAAIQENLETLQGTMRSKEENAARERKQLEEQLQSKIKESQDQAGVWETRFKTNEIDRSLQDAAVSADAYQPSQIVTLLKPMTRLIEDIDARTGKASGKFNTVIDFQDVNTEGEPIISVMTPKDAVKRMKQLPDIYGNLFKSGVVPGIGANSGTGAIPGQNGKLNLRGLTPEQYRKLRAEDPAKLGLRR